jgi:outer membrane immunogenic protein
MRTLIAILMASAASFIAISAANAADAVEQIPQAPVAVDTPVINTWQGFYLGGYGNYGWGSMGPGDRDVKGFGGGAFTGYNWQSGQIVYGLEADLGYSGQDGAASGGAYRAETGWNGSVRGRVGYDLNPFMIYGTAGLAVANAELKDATSSDDKTLVGYTVGAGAEAFVTNNVTARIEYRYTDFGKDTYNLNSGAVSQGFDDHSVRVGIGVKF